MKRLRRKKWNADGADFQDLQDLSNQLRISSINLLFKGNTGAAFGVCMPWVALPVRRSAHRLVKAKRPKNGWLHEWYLYMYLIIYQHVAQFNFLKSSKK